MTKVLLINPPETSQDGFTTPPLGLLYLAGTLRTFGIDVKILDGCLLGWNAVQSALQQYGPQLVGITCLTPGRKKAVQVAQMVKAHCPEITVVMGGAHPTIMYKQMLENYSSIDVIVRGEGEVTLLELAQGRPWAEIEGICYRTPQGVVRNRDRKPIENLDNIPFPAWDLIDLSQYPAIGSGIINGIDMGAEPRISVIFTRGCSGNCEFCSSWWIWQGHRCRTPKNMAEELQLLNRHFGVKHFNFADDAFSVHRQWTMELCQEIINRQLKMAFFITTRVDCVDPEMLALLKQAGCYMIAYGIETGSQKLLDMMQKKTCIQRAREALVFTHQAGIGTFALLIVGNMGETRETINETVEFIQETKPTHVGAVGGLWIFPGTILYQKCKQMGIINDDFWLSDQPYMVYTVEHSENELKEFANALGTRQKLPLLPSSFGSKEGAVLTHEEMYQRRWQMDPSIFTLDWWQNHFCLKTALNSPIIHGQVIDLGCGTGEIDIWLARNGYGVTGVDISPTALRFAQEHLAKEDKDIQRRVKFLNGFIEDLQLKEKSFDSCLMSEVFEHVADPESIFWTLSKVLKDNGKVLILVPLGNAYDDPTHVKHFDPQSLWQDLTQYARDVRIQVFPEELQLVAEVGDFKFKPKEGNKIVCMMRVRNEEKWLAQSLAQTSKIADAIVILDDGSTDRTPQICKECSRVVDYHWQNLPTDEARDRNRLLEMALKLKPHWILSMDGDEVLEDAAVGALQEVVELCPQDVGQICLELLYFWDGYDKYRVDGIFHSIFFPRMFRVKGQDINQLKFYPTSHGCGIHCGSLPSHIVGETMNLDIKIKHYGYLTREQRVEKYYYYQVTDPQTVQTGYYDIILDETGIQFRPWQERSTTGVRDQIAKWCIR